MVYRPLPRMTASEDANRRSSKLYKLFILTIVIGAFASAYYLYSYATANKNLKRKQRNLSYQLSKYAAAYGKCERSLKTTKSDVLNFQESNKQLQANLKAKEKSLADSDRANSETSIKLDQSYQFFLDVKGLLKDDQAASEDKVIIPEASNALKAEIENLKSASAELTTLRQKASETSKAHSQLQVAYDELASRASNLEKQVIELNQHNQHMTADLGKKSEQSQAKDSKLAVLEQTVEKLKEELAQAKEAKASAEAKAAEKPANEKPVAEKPATKKPADENPATDALASKAPATEAPKSVAEKLAEVVKKNNEKAAAEKTEVNKETGKLTKTVDTGSAPKPQVEDTAVATERRIVEEQHALKIAPTTKAPTTAAAPATSGAAKTVPASENPGAVGGDAEEQTEADVNKELDSLSEGNEDEEEEDNEGLP